MKILNVMFSKVNGGLEQVFLNYHPTLESQGNEVLAVIHPKAEIRSFCPPNKVVCIHNFNAYDPLALYRLKRLIRREKPDCILMHSYRAAYLLKKIKTSAKKVAVCHVKSHYNLGADAYIAISQAMAEDIIQSGHSPSSVYIIPNMLPQTQIQPYKAPQPKQSPVIGVCSRLAHNKGVDVFIRALARLKNKGIAFHGLIAGDGQAQEEIDTLIENHRLNQDVTRLGWIHDKHSFYESIDIFCLPSREEAFGLVVLEAMAESKPMVLSALSGPKEIIGTSECALFASPGDDASLAEALEKLIHQPSLQKSLSLKAHQRVLAYTAETIGPRLNQALHNICASSKHLTT